MVLIIFTLGLYFFIVTSIVTTFVQFHRTWTAGYIATVIGGLVLGSILLSVFPWPTHEGARVKPLLQEEQDLFPRAEPRTQFYMDAKRTFGCPPEPWWPRSSRQSFVRQLSGSTTAIARAIAADAVGLTTPIRDSHFRARLHSDRQ